MELRIKFRGSKKELEAVRNNLIQIVVATTPALNVYQDELGYHLQEKLEALLEIDKVTSWYKTFPFVIMGVNGFFNKNISYTFALDIDLAAIEELLKPLDTTFTTLCPLLTSYAMLIKQAKETGKAMPQVNQSWSEYRQSLKSKVSTTPV
ncbi:hypothetical protein vBAmePPT11V19_00078 [Alteromonas phage vB_AmeP_PT11-V19]|nr:hypothetical protein vBAmePPT11V19_00078 [Alteromonas phage vB_AmeP_PT11-V19]